MRPRPAPDTAIRTEFVVLTGRQIQAIAEVYQGTQDVWSLKAAGPNLVLCPPKGPLGVAFPEIDATAQPIMSPFAWQHRIARKHTRTDRCVAAMVPQDVDRMLSAHR